MANGFTAQAAIAKIDCSFPRTIGVKYHYIFDECEYEVDLTPGKILTVYGPEGVAIGHGTVIGGTIRISSVTAFTYTPKHTLGNYTQI